MSEAGWGSPISKTPGAVALGAPGHLQTLSQQHISPELLPTRGALPRRQARPSEQRNVGQAGRTLTEELGGVGAGGLLVVGEPLVDDLAHGRVEALQLLVLGGHAGSACNRSGTVGPGSGWQAQPSSERC